MGSNDTLYFIPRLIVLAGKHDRCNSLPRDLRKQVPWSNLNSYSKKINKARYSWRAPFYLIINFYYIRYYAPSIVYEVFLADVFLERLLRRKNSNVYCIAFPQEMLEGFVVGSLDCGRTNMCTHGSGAEDFMITLQYWTIDHLLFESSIVTDKSSTVSWRLIISFFQSILC